jgi:hypothetical protein
MAVQQVQNLPAQFVQDLGQDLAKQIVAQSGVPVVSTGIAGISRQPGESDADFAARQSAAQAFTTRQQNLSGLAPTVAGQDRLQQQAQSLAEQGVGSYRPFLDQAQVASAATFDRGVQQQFMSPYQQQVIDTTLSEFDRQAQAREQAIRDQAYTSGAFGGGREGVALAEYRSGSDRNRAALQAGLLQQGFGQAQNLASQRFNQQQGLAQLVPGLQGTDISRLGSLGALNQAQAQATADAQREAARQAAFLPQQQLDRYANQVTGIMGGYPGSTQLTATPNPTPLQSALGIGTTLAGIYGAINNPNKTDFGRVLSSGLNFFTGR